MNKLTIRFIVIIKPVTIFIDDSAIHIAIGYVLCLCWLKLQNTGRILPFFL